MTKIGIMPGIIGGKVSVPPSKSYTHRAIFSALFAKGKSTIINPLFSKDIDATIRTVEMFGATVKKHEKEFIVESDSIIKVPENIIDVENSGTTLRIATSIAALVKKGYTVLTGDESIRSRPMGPLLEALQKLGVNCWSTRLNGYPPIIVQGGGISGNSIEIDGSISSQFITSLLMAAPKSKNGLKIKVLNELVSKRYIDVTIKVLNAFGIEVIQENEKSFVVKKQDYKPTSFKIPADFGAASFFIGLGALSEKEITVSGLDFSLPQPDMKIIDVVRSFGADVSVDKDKGEVTVRRKELKGININLKDCPDLLPITAIIASMAEGKTVIEGVKHARYKESDRIAVLARELPKFGVKVKEREDGLVIWGVKKLKPCHLETAKDHRIFMALAIAAIFGEAPCILDGFETVGVSYPRFVDDLGKLGIRVKVIEGE